MPHSRPTLTGVYAYSLFKAVLAHKELESQAAEVELAEVVMATAAREGAATTFYTATLPGPSREKDPPHHLRHARLSRMPSCISTQRRCWIGGSGNCALGHNDILVEKADFERNRQARVEGHDEDDEETGCASFGGREDGVDVADEK
ncbi:hypothetical protein K438DRAFT_1974712 [Mycena galopus ATCC 62051]|nr:hypothetical protein K438DRAFT_1974712 [Mycena galopus ATCC 62051]